MKRRSKGTGKEGQAAKRIGDRVILVRTSNRGEFPISAKKASAFIQSFPGKKPGKARVGAGGFFRSSIGEELGGQESHRDRQRSSATLQLFHDQLCTGVDAHGKGKPRRRISNVAKRSRGRGLGRHCRAQVSIRRVLKVVVLRSEEKFNLGGEQLREQMKRDPIGRRFVPDGTKLSCKVPVVAGGVWG